MLCAMGATINRAARFDSVPNHVALTVSASWRHRVNRTFEAIERQVFAGLRDSKGLVVVVTADIANRHRAAKAKNALVRPARTFRRPSNLRPAVAMKKFNANNFVMTCP
jgi:hypothetical protein